MDWIPEEDTLYGEPMLQKNPDKGLKQLVYRSQPKRKQLDSINNRINSRNEEKACSRWSSKLVYQKQIYEALRAN